MQIKRKISKVAVSARKSIKKGKKALHKCVLFNKDKAKIYSVEFRNDVKFYLETGKTGQTAEECEGDFWAREKLMHRRAWSMKYRGIHDKKGRFQEYTAELEAYGLDKKDYLDPNAGRPPTWQPRYELRPTPAQIQYYDSIKEYDWLDGDAGIHCAYRECLIAFLADNLTSKPAHLADVVRACARSCETMENIPWNKEKQIPDQQLFISWYLQACRTFNANSQSDNPRIRYNYEIPIAHDEHAYVNVAIPNMRWYSDKGDVVFMRVSPEVYGYGWLQLKPAFVKHAKAFLAQCIKDYNEIGICQQNHFKDTFAEDDNLSVQFSDSDLSEDEIEDRDRVKAQTFNLNLDLLEYMKLHPSLKGKPTMSWVYKTTVNDTITRQQFYYLVDAGLTYNQWPAFAVCHHDEESTHLGTITPVEKKKIVELKKEYACVIGDAHLLHERLMAKFEAGATK